MPRRFSSGSRSASIPVSALTSAVLPWSMWPAVPTRKRFTREGYSGRATTAGLDSLFAHARPHRRATLKSAMKAGDKRRVATLRLLLSALKNEKIQAQRELTDEEAEAVIRRAVKQRRDSIEQYTRGGRAGSRRRRDGGARDPRGLPAGGPDRRGGRGRDPPDHRARRASPPRRTSGLVMKELMAAHRGRVDGKRAQEIARRLLP